MRRKPKRTFAQFKVHIIGLVEYLQDFFLVKEYRYRIVWRETDLHEDDPAVAATMKSEYPYTEFTLTVYAPVYEHFLMGKDLWVYRVLVHEFGHVLLEPVVGGVRGQISADRMDMLANLIENLIERITIIAMWAKNSSAYKFKGKKK